MSELEHRLRKIEISLEWMSNRDNILTHELDKLMDKVDALDSKVSHLMDKGQETMFPQPDPDGWIPWEGGECPVEGGKRVDVRFRNGKEPPSGWSTDFNWCHEGDDVDIISYRPTKQEAEWPQVGDYYHVISTDGEIDKHRWQGGTLDTKMLNSPLGIYPTHTKAEEAAGKIKRVMDHLREGHEVDLAKWQHNGSARIKKDTIKL